MYMSQYVLPIVYIANPTASNIHYQRYVIRFKAHIGSMMHICAYAYVGVPFLTAAIEISTCVVFEIFVLFSLVILHATRLIYMIFVSIIEKNAIHNHLIERMKRQTDWARGSG